MKIKVVTNLREFIVGSDDFKTQNRGGVGVSIFGIAKKQLRKNEEIIVIEDMEEEDEELWLS